MLYICGEQNKQLEIMTNLQKLNKAYKATPSNRALITDLYNRAVFIDGEKLDQRDYLDYSKKVDLRYSSGKDHCAR